MSYYYRKPSTVKYTTNYHDPYAAIRFEKAVRRGLEAAVPAMAAVPEGGEAMHYLRLEFSHMDAEQLRALMKELGFESRLTVRGRVASLAFAPSVPKGFKRAAAVRALYEEIRKDFLSVEEVLYEEG